MARPVQYLYVAIITRAGTKVPAVGWLYTSSYGARPWCFRKPAALSGMAGMCCWGAMFILGWAGEVPAQDYRGEARAAKVGQHRGAGPPSSVCGP